MIARRPFTAVARIALAAALLAGSAGCGVFSALGNPKAAWALQEPAPMAVTSSAAPTPRAPRPSTSIA